MLFRSIVAQEAGRAGAAVELQHFDVGLLRDFVGFLFIPQTGVDEPDQRAVVLSEQAGQGRCTGLLHRIIGARLDIQRLEWLQSGYLSITDAT